MDRIKNAWRTALVCGLLAGLTLLVYWPVFHHDFIRFDDGQYVTDNPHVLGGVKPAEVAWAFRTGYASNWHPLTWISHMLDVQLFGLRAGWHHLTSLLLHTASAVLLLLALRRLTGAFWRSAFVAALFALHPLHVESVAWVAERKDVLSTFFFMLTLLSYAIYVEKQSKVPSLRPKLAPGENASRSTPYAYLWYALTLLWFAFGLMSKPMLVTLPCVLLLLDFWPLERIRPSALNQQLSAIRFLFLEKLPFFVLSTVSSVVTFIVQDRSHAVSTGATLSLEPRVVNTLMAYVKYLGMTLWPRNLCIFYPYPVIHGTTYERPEWQVVGAALLLVAITLFVLARLKRGPWLAIGWFWFLGTLVPVIGLVQVGGQALADRYTYIPLIGIFMALSWALGEWIPSRESAAQFVAQPRKSRVGKPTSGGVGATWPRGGMACTFAGGACLLLGICAVLTRGQVGYWQNNFTVFSHALAVVPDNAEAHYYVGLHYRNEGKYALAEEHFRAALQIDPVCADALHGLGYELARQNRLSEAAEQYQTALRVQPWRAQFHDALGTLYLRQAKLPEALTEYAQALQIDPDLAQAHFNLGLALATKGDLNGAADQFATVLRLTPADTEAASRLAQVLALQGKRPEAEAQFRTLVQRAPNDAPLHFDFAQLLRLEGKTEEALAQYAEVIRLSPDRLEPYHYAGSLLLQQGRAAEAATRFSEAVQRKADDLEALSGWGRALAAQGKLTEAAARLGDAARLCPTNAESQVALGNALMLTGQTNAAARAFAAALSVQPDLAEKTLQVGKGHLEQGQFEAALANFTTASWLKPDSAEAHECLGQVLAQQGKAGDAVRQFEQVLRLRPDAQAHCDLGLARLIEGRRSEAVTNYLQALQLNPDCTQALNDLAWLRATAPEPGVRNGTQAVTLAERLCQLTATNQPQFLGTLAAAYAEAGRFADAVKTAEQAKAMASAANQQALADRNEQLLQLYRASKPYHEGQ